MDLIFNETFNYEVAKEWSANMEWRVVQISVTYVTLIFAIKYAMRDRKPYDLQRPLNVWNAFLAVFSIIGFIQLTPVFLAEIRNKGIQATYTQIGSSFTDNVAGYWVFLWVFSKIPELIDTIFLVLRKRPLMLMHWWHHAFTGVFSFCAYGHGNAFMIWIVWLNFFIHSFMYSYYMVRSFRFRVPPQIAQIITGAQIIQFLITHVVMIHLAILCLLNPLNHYAVTSRAFIYGAFMEITYLILWIRFYYVSYIANGGKKYNQYQATAEHSKLS
ncbi:hypothetical protein AB6A40_001900 [Gnathostoma spinigerum]|uniref:Elongation of very long chain fatty acids protein n=1 Tax=Gnathostoma spinigerum TaxID=75299 RepID=A0ABD6ECU8_9BILA